MRIKWRLKATGKKKFLLLAEFLIDSSVFCALHLKFEKVPIWHIFSQFLQITFFSLFENHFNKFEISIKSFIL
jgi:hypothetical protein